MTEIKLMNYGRGAGKTHTLVRWLDEAPDRRFLVSQSLVRSVKNKNIFYYTTSLTIIKEAVSKNNCTEIAFDDFNFKKPEHLHILLVLSYLTNIKTVILATTHEAMETDAAKTWGLSESKTPIPGFYSVEETKDSLIFKRLPYTPTGENLRRSRGFHTDEKVGVLMNGGTIKVDGAIQTANIEQKEPIQSVKARDLRIGDWVVGKGHVFSLSEADSYIGSLFKVYTEDKALGFEGEMKLMPDTLLDVDITKRK